MPHFHDPVYVNGVAVQAGISSQTALTHLTDSTGGATGDNTLAAITANSALTDSSGGTGSTTLAALGTIAISTAGGNTYADSAVNTAVNAKLAILANHVASVAARLAEVRTAIGVIKDDLADLAAKQNAALAALESAGVLA